MTDPTRSPAQPEGTAYGPGIALGGRLGGIGPGPIARLGRRGISRGLNGGPQQGTSEGGVGRRERPPHHQAQRPGARQETLRESNLLLITEEIFSAAESLSRADLSIRTGMTRSTVSRLVDDLLAAGIVREGSPIVGGTRGRPAVPLHPARCTLAGLGVEINVDFMAARVIDLTGSVLAEEIIEGDFSASDPAEVLPQIGLLALRVARQASEAGARVVGTVMALPGLVTAEEDRLMLAPNLGWRDVDVPQMMCRSLGGPEQLAELPEGSPRLGGFGDFFVVANEAKLSALAAAQEFSAHEEGEQTFFYVSAQMGIGAAVVIDGIVDAGPRGWAGEIGHVAVEPGGPQCRCGASGCLEVFAGKGALLEAAGLEPAASAEELVSLTEWEDEPGERARQAIDRAGWALGVALSGAVNLLDVDDIVLGGEFGPLADLLRPRIEQELRQRVLAARWSRFRVRETTTGVAPATTGGALRALRAVVDDPLRWVPEAG
ncbi:ROK family transcriptional regulator [Nesterenkonia sp. HG001]|uniref:ROK family transcriptional regulator n=1 Tax=Nesterenkonia sp. HG001 TaxID=2983207 RepID=UPI002AC522F9|nr:ROK family transcriptional regulator [Nesterenkonia sp. HG001]MDZ5078232.1 ROK family transcriptional regulator [Nesterenkonia sp. HG001]